MGAIVIILAGIIGMFAIMAAWYSSNQKQCPPNKVMVITGKSGKSERIRLVQGGSVFVWPSESYDFLDLTPFKLNSPIKAKSKDGKAVDIEAVVTLAISPESGILDIAAERLLGLPTNHIEEMADNIIRSESKKAVSFLDSSEINLYDDKLQSDLFFELDDNFKGIGLKVLNINVANIQFQ